MTPVEQFIQIVKDGGAGVVCTSMVDDDIRAFYQQPWVMVGERRRHRRAPSARRRHVSARARAATSASEQWLTLPEAIRKMTSAPADG